MDDLIELIVQSMADDIRWQDNLIDGERSYLLDLARYTLQSVVSAERTRLYTAFIGVNASMSEAGDGQARADLFRDVLLAVGL